MAAVGRRSRLRLSDLLALGSHGLKAHPLRAALSALGIAIGIAAMVAVIGISTSSQALVKEKLDSLGTDMLTASAGKNFLGKDSTLPEDAVQRIRRIDGVRTASWTATLDKVNVYRNSAVDPGATGGLTVLVGEHSLPEATSAKLAEGSWLNAATERYPAVVLGSTAARTLGIQHAGVSVWLGGTQYTVAGVLERVPLAPELDGAAIIGAGIAKAQFGFDGSPTRIYERSDDARVGAIRELLPATINPQAPNEVKVSRPSDALAAKNTIDQAFTGLLVGVGSIALLVGGIGVANTMVISVLERRKEIGMRRSLGATRRHIRLQFLIEAVLLAAYGGAAGSALGLLITALVARGNGWMISVPPIVLVAGVLVTIVVGAVAGVLPAIRAARTSPTEALSA